MNDNETVYRINEIDTDKYVSAGSTNRTMWTRRADVQRHIDERNIKGRKPKFAIHTFDLVRRTT